MPLSKRYQKWPKAQSEELKAAFAEHWEETMEQIGRLKNIFKMLDSKAEGKECPALKGLIQETEALLSDAKNPAVLDAGLIGCAQAVEHYEMARYGTLKAWAEQLEMEDAAELLEETLEEEKAADEKLSELAFGGLNEEAEGEEDDEDEEKPKQASARKK